MAYVLVLLGLLGAFVWVSPAKSDVASSLGDSTRALGSVLRQAAFPLAGYGTELLAKLRGKAMELLREQLHDAIDTKVQ